MSLANPRGESVIDYEMINAANTVNVKFASAALAGNVAGTQAAGTPIQAANVTISSAGVAYSATLPKALPGLEIDVVCITAVNTVAVFPAVGDTINALSANTGLTFAALTSATFLCITAGAWFTSPRVPS